MKQIERHLQAQATVKNHNLCLMKMIVWIETNYKSYLKNVVINLTRAQKEDVDLYYTSTKDFKYENLEPDVIKAFLSTNKIKSVDEDGKETYYSFDNLCKFKDAILFGAKRAKKML